MVSTYEDHCDSCEKEVNTKTFRIVVCKFNWLVDTEVFQERSEKFVFIYITNLI